MPVPEKIAAPELLVIFNSNGKIGFDGVAADTPMNRSFAELTVKRMQIGAKTIKYIPVEVVAEKKPKENK